ncbi:VOC family protein [Kineosporia succinea]|uniref:3-demethylubiquinone-9 3-methyltransferase (Glyoxalase superfamily) n=1 Tax=Kineosporia succinea TaxID=84632 RepID=A0ABT9P7L3_9ACTN|nr:VOC family protein [Kineosporia succinea]MDP9828682.1 putative 3-demethylubiquinone-9 3-methyltransferase (glyoxalase superfamily) [Kineosporia succinea]
MPTIQPSLWFDGNAEEAVAFWSTVFPNSSTVRTSRFGPDSPGPEGGVMAIDFVLDGRPFVAINGGPQFPFTEAVSFTIPCTDQAEVDHYWFALIADGGQESECGWLKDRFGVSWQVVPEILNELIADPDRDRSSRAVQAMLRMKRLVIADLVSAAEGR